MPQILDHVFEGGHTLGYSQLNELLLLCGFDRVNHAFFQYLVDGTADYVPGAPGLVSLDALRDGVERFEKVALFTYGNVKFAFKDLSRHAEILGSLLAGMRPWDETAYSTRHDPLRDIEPISSTKTFYLGYIVRDQIARRLEENPADEDARKEMSLRTEVVEQGTRNHEAYLICDHLDVYVATSMRERHEYLQVGDWTEKIFSDPLLTPLKLRYFDPTQAYCPDRVDKGLVEALMLKRAKCTLYFAQETDTLGKDSELASTLAQGKPVIAYVPSVSDGYLDELLATLKTAYPERDERSLILDQLQVFAPTAAWRDAEIRKWVDGPSTFPVEKARAYLEKRIQEHYEKRAKTLKESHPLGIQVHLNTGVANGVLVVRSLEQCVELVRRVLLRRLDFKIDRQTRDGRHYVFLRETISGCIFRVMTGDPMLTNTFWNFYLSPAE